MRADLAARQLSDRKAAFVGWVTGLVAYTLLIVAVYPTVRDSEGLSQVLDDYPDALKEFLGGAAALDLSSGSGFVNAEMFSFVLPVLLVIVAIGMGASIGGDQRTGLMDLILANPVSRRRVVLERVVAMAATTFGLSFVVGFTLAVAGPMVDLDLGVNALIAALTLLTLLVTFHGLVALLVGAATGRRSTAIGAATGLFAIGYVVSGLGGLVGWLEPAREVSLYHHVVAANSLSDGWSLWPLVILGGACALAAFGAVVMFDRRDIV